MGAPIKWRIKPGKTLRFRPFYAGLFLVLLLVLTGLLCWAQGVADLAVSQSGSPAPVGTSSNLTYSLIVTNAGPDSASGVVLTDILPAGVSFVSASSGCVPNAGVVQCAIGGLSANSSVTITLTVTVTLCGGSVTNQASVAGDQSDPNQADNTSSAVNPILPVSPPAIAAQPKNQTVPMRNGAVFSVGASAAAPLAYQWQTNGIDIWGKFGGYGLHRLSSAGQFLDE